MARRAFLSVLCIVSAAAAAAADVQARQVHLSLAGDGAARVAYFTVNASAATCSFGAAGGALNSTATGSTVSYLSDGGFHHVVRLSGLVPGATYTYSCGAPGAASPPATFTAAPAAGSAHAFSAVIFGDWGWLNSTARGAMLPVGGLDSNWTASPAYELLSALAPAADLAWIVGDIAYADDSFGHIDELLGFGYEKAYNGFMDTDWLGALAPSLPVMVSPGNHESECHDPYCVLNEAVGQQLRNFSAYNARWAMPSAESGGVLNMWYSWTHGRVHFVSINTETDFPGAPEENAGDSHFPWLRAGHFAPDGAYLAWLEKDLAAAAAARAAGTVDFVVAGGHRPTEDFSSAAVIALFKKYAVDVYVYGHGHSYARYDAAAYGDGTVHVMVGGAGCEEMRYPSDQVAAADAPGYDAAAACAQWCNDAGVRKSFPAAQDPCRYCAAAPVYVSDQYAIGKLTIDAAGDLSWQLLLGPSGRVLDGFNITKAAAASRAAAAAKALAA